MRVSWPSPVVATSWGPIVLGEPKDIFIVDLVVRLCTWKIETGVPLLIQEPNQVQPDS